MNDLTKNVWKGEESQQDATFNLTDDGLKLKGVPNLRENQWTTPPQPTYTTGTRFVLKVNGAVVSAPYATSNQALQHLQSLPPSTQLIAEIVQVDANGRELLLG